MNKDNLIPGAHKLTREENSLGGTNSAISRKAKKRALEIAREILSMPVDDGVPKEIEEMSSLKDASEVTLDVLTLILVNMSKKAIKGDLRACKDLLTISGDYTERQETTIGIGDSVIYDPNKTEYIQRINIHINDDPDRCLDSPRKPSEVRYYDYDGNLAKVIYGEEAERLIELHCKEQLNKGIPIDYEFVIDDEELDR